MARAPSSAGRVERARSLGCRARLDLRPSLTAAVRRGWPARSRHRAGRRVRAAGWRGRSARCRHPSVAGHVAHQLTTAVRRPASAATSQNVFARRSLPLAIAGRVRRTRSVAPRIARPRGDGSAIATLPCMPATRRVSRPCTPCTSGGWPVATSSIPAPDRRRHRRATRAARACRCSAAVRAGSRPLAESSSKMRASKPSMAMTRSAQASRHDRQRVARWRGARGRVGRPCQQQRGAAKRDRASRDRRPPATTRRSPARSSLAAVPTAGQHHRRRGHGDGMAQQQAHRGGERERRERPDRRRPSEAGDDGLPPQREVNQAERA